MHRIGIAGLSVVAMLLPLGACAPVPIQIPAPPPPPSGTPGKIAFSSDRDGNPSTASPNPILVSLCFLGAGEIHFPSG